MGLKGFFPFQPCCVFILAIAVEVAVAERSRGVAGVALPWGSSNSYVHQAFQVPKMEVYTYRYKLYVRLIPGKTRPQNGLVRFSTSIFGTWNSWWYVAHKIHDHGISIPRLPNTKLEEVLTWTPKTSNVPKKKREKPQEVYLEDSGIYRFGIKTGGPLLVIINKPLKTPHKGVTGAIIREITLLICKGASPTPNIPIFHAPLSGNFSKLPYIWTVWSPPREKVV